MVSLRKLPTAQVGFKHLITQNLIERKFTITVLKF